ncbi:zinc-binding dehydrogenase [Streptomyces sp. NPDC059761]|uniref:zinc-binding dehydrogenase n=1 Tax=Streptomyces sp. NPDC059761 TaxID=3346937 RepID=UPI0036533FC6
MLIHGAAGGVGHLGVQIAKARGAYVIGTARAAKHDYLRGLGADELIDYTVEDFSALRGIDAVLDTVSNDYGPRSLPTLKPGGILIDVVGVDRTEVTARAAERARPSLVHGVGPDQPHLGEADAVRSWAARSPAVSSKPSPTLA